MNTRYKLLIEIANLILEKVKQYLSESNSLDEETFVWVDWDTRCVLIGKAGEEHEGDKIPICDFFFRRRRYAYAGLRSDRHLCRNRMALPQRRGAVES